MIIKYTKHYPREIIHTIDLDELQKVFGKKEEVWGTDKDWNGGKKRRVVLYSGTKLKKLLKAMNDFDCDKSKDEILAEIKNPKMLEIWKEVDTHD